MASSPDRFNRTIEYLQAGPAERVLEIGCGSGEALARLALREPSIHLVGLDRSALALERSRKRLAGLDLEDRVDLVHGEIPGCHPLGLLHRIFAINVNAFWIKPEEVFSDVLARLAAGGVLVLSYQTPSAARTREIRERLLNSAQHHRLEVEQSDVSEDARYFVLRGLRTG